jgi:hypothetical protein
MRGQLHSDIRTAIDAGVPASHSRRSVGERAVNELKRFLIMFIYLWVMFGLFALHERIVLRQSGASLASQGFAVVNALVLAKVMLIAEDLKVGHWVRPRPLIYPIVGESLIFAIVFICFHVVEHVVIGLFKGETIAASVPAIGGGGLAGLACVAVIMFAALIPFFAFRNVSRELGEGQLNAMLFGTGSKIPAGR